MQFLFNMEEVAKAWRCCVFDDSLSKMGGVMAVVVKIPDSPSECAGSAAEGASAALAEED